MPRECRVSRGLGHEVRDQALKHWVAEQNASEGDMFPPNHALVGPNQKLPGAEYHITNTGKAGDNFRARKSN